MAKAKEEFAARPIRLIAGLGNPGLRYHDTRHNAGVWLVERLALTHGTTLIDNKKFLGRTAKINAFDHDCYLLAPTTYMNHSGEAVRALAHFYKIAVEEILIVHDELDLPCGECKLKYQGGHGGHNGLRNIIDHLHNKNFARLRIGIGRPPAGQQGVDYVLGIPSRSDRQKIDDAIAEVSCLLDDVIEGKHEKAMQILHTKE